MSDKHFLSNILLDIGANSKHFVTFAARKETKDELNKDL